MAEPWERGDPAAAAPAPAANVRMPWDPPPSGASTTAPATLSGETSLMQDIRDTGSDVAKATGSGALSGAISSSGGMFGDIREFGDSVGDWIDRKLLEHGVIDQKRLEEIRKNREERHRDSWNPLDRWSTTSERFKELTGEDPYQAKTLPGRIAGAASGMVTDLPNYLGGGGLIRKAVTSGLSGAGGEVGSELGEQVGLPTLGRFLGSAGTSLGLSRGVERAAEQTRRSQATPTGPQVASAGRAVGATADEQAITQNAARVSTMFQQAVRDARQRGGLPRSWFTAGGGAGQELRNEAGRILKDIDDGNIAVVRDNVGQSRLADEIRKGKPVLLDREHQILEAINRGESFSNIMAAIGEHPLVGLAHVFGHGPVGTAAGALGALGRTTGGRRSEEALERLAEDVRWRSPAAIGARGGRATPPLPGSLTAGDVGAAAVRGASADALAPAEDDALR